MGLIIVKPNGNQCLRLDDQAIFNVRSIHFTVYFLWYLHMIINKLCIKHNKDWTNEARLFFHKVTRTYIVTWNSPYDQPIRLAASEFQRWCNCNNSYILSRNLKSIISCQLPYHVILILLIDRLISNSYVYIIYAKEMSSSHFYVKKQDIPLIQSCVLYYIWYYIYVPSNDSTLW